MSTNHRRESSRSGFSLACCRSKYCSKTFCLASLVGVAELDTHLFLDTLFFTLKTCLEVLTGVGGPLNVDLENIGKTLPEGPGLLPPSLAGVAGVCASGDRGRGGSTRPSGVVAFPAVAGAAGPEVAYG